MPTDNLDDNGWGEYGKFVLAELRRLASGQEKLNDFLVTMSRDNDKKIETLRTHYDDCVTELREQVSVATTESAVNRTKIAVIVGIGSLVGGAVVSLIIMLVEHSL